MASTKFASEVKAKDVNHADRITYSHKKPIKVIPPPYTRILRARLGLHTGYYTKVYSSSLRS